MKNIQDILDGFEPISLEEMDSVRLQNRTDTKYILHRSDLEKVLTDVQDQYKALLINNTKCSPYKTLYYDTDGLDFYFLHHRGKANRHKIRMRQYVDSDLTFLEIKFKNSKGRTIKNRVVVEDFEMDLSNESKRFISEISGIRSDLHPVLWNHFERITLVNEKGPERATIDLNLSFVKDEETFSMDNIAIVEVKQQRMNRDSPLVQALKKYHIRPTGMSKYCFGIASLFDGIKKNTFKERIRKITKINGFTAATA